jgi:hypothetical protein
MRLVNVRTFFVAAIVSVSGSLFANAQSFPPALISPIQTSQNYSFDQSPSVVTDPSGVNPYLYMAYGSTTSNDYLYVGTSVDGLNWTDHAQTTLKKGFSPAMTFYNGTAWVAYVSDGQGGLINGALYLISVPNLGVSGHTSAYLVTSNGSPMYPTNSPTAAVFNGQLWINMIDSYGNVLTFATTNGYSFSTVGGCGSADPAGYFAQPSAAVGMVAFNNQMYYAYQTTSGNLVRVCSVDGSGNITYSTPSVYPAGSGISATVYAGYLTLSYKDNTGGNHVIVEGTTDGVNYNGEDYAFSMNGSNQINPSAAPYNNALYMVITGNSSNHHQWTTHN